jgi:asparagine synthase (glutamine-hydrolysing)
MCGIVGFVDRSARADSVALLQRMSSSLVHRGPDDTGSVLLASETAPDAPQVGLAMRRLAIIDLETGRQPIANEDETCWIIYNGEIYNHRQLRRELEGKGHRFRTASDTEAILHAYEEYGVDCVRHMRGMFAFAIWDARQERLFLARDPVGIKPLYWTRSGDRLLFASEIKALLQDPAVPRRVSADGLHHFLTYLYVPAPQTMFEGIHQLPPGHRLVWQRGTLTVEEYWAGPAAMLEGQAGPPVAPEEVWEVLKESVGAHLLSDVPLGAFLSGGLDSTAIVALMAELCSQPVRTFSIGFRDSGLYDELKYARQVAQHLRTDHHEFVVDSDAVGLLPEIIRHLDEPLADASVIPNYLVAQLARRSVTVALTGIGGDELFGGYRRYYGDAMARRWQLLPRAVRRHVLLPALRLIPVNGDTFLGDGSRLAQKFLEPLDLAPEPRYLAWNAFYAEEDKRQLYALHHHRPAEDGSHALMMAHFDRMRHRPFADRAMYLDLKSYLPGDPLFLSDRMTMANSLEARVPFLDPRVMEFAARVPLSQKIQGQKTKIILRQMLAGKVPPEILHRPKRGFGTPIDLWLQRELSGLMDQVLSPGLLRERGYFCPEYVTWLREQQALGRRDFSQHLWALLVFELWHRAFIDTNLSSRQGLTFEDLGLSSSLQPTMSDQSRAPDPLPSVVAESHGSWTVPTQPAARRTGNPLRILMVADVDPVHVIGGAERMLNEHCRRLAGRGHRIVVLTRRDDPSLPIEEQYHGVRVVRHPVGGVGPVGFVRTVLREGGAAFSRLVEQEGFDLVNVHQPLAAAAIMGRAGAARLPVLYSYHSPWADEYQIRRRRRSRPLGAAAGLGERAWVHLNSQARERLERRALWQSDRMMVLSDFSTSQLRRIHQIPVERVVVIPGGVDVNRFRPAANRAGLRRDLGLPEGQLLLTVRNLEPRMGLDSLITAMRTVLAAKPDCRLVIGGSGPLKEQLVQQVRELGLEHAIRFTGFIPEERLPDYYAAADLFVLPTRHLEGFGLVTVEALACGTPVLGTPVGGTQEILCQFDPRFLFQSAEPEAIAERILEWLPRIQGDDEVRARCRRYALEHYSWDVLIPQVEALMEQIVNQRIAVPALQ